MKLELLTWLQVQQIDLSTPVIIPTGALEQHGPHLPLYTDTLFVEAIANAVELELSNEVLLTPVLWVGGSENLMDFSGTITATPSSYISNLQAIIRSLSKHGFYKFCVLNSHGGNTDLNSVALRELKAENKNLVLTHFAYWELLTDVLAKVQEGPLKKLLMLANLKQA
jgi:creatinine amidohydrolase